MRMKSASFFVGNTYQFFLSLIQLFGVFLNVCIRLTMLSLSNLKICKIQKIPTPTPMGGDEGSGLVDT